MLLASGPEFADETSIYRTPLAAVLPAQPTGEVITQGYRPLITRAGFAHPVTRDLPFVNDAVQANTQPQGPNAPPATGAAAQPLPPGAEELPAQPNWGHWFRLIAAQRLSGNTVMSGPGDRPLLVLDRIQKGRVAQLLSDQIWLWARGYENGGPQAIPEQLRLEIERRILTDKQTHHDVLQWLAEQGLQGYICQIRTLRRRCQEWGISRRGVTEDLSDFSREGCLWSRWMNLSSVYLRRSGCLYVHWAHLAACGHLGP